MVKRLMQASLLILALVTLTYLDPKQSRATILPSNQPMTATNNSSGTPTPPLADFIPTKREGNPPFTIQLLNQSQGDYSSSHWDFGDGQSSTAPNPTHTYAMTGPVTVKLTVTGPAGSSTITKTDLIKVHSFPPVHPDGWDLTFGDYGFVDTDCAQSGPQYNFSTVERQRDGKLIVLAGCNNVYGLLLTRYLPDGALDPTFGVNGRVPLTDTYAYATLLIQPDDKLVVVHDLRVRRFLADGAVDGSFGVQGMVDAFPGATFYSPFTHAVLQTDGKVVAVGVKDKQPMIARYTTDGALDASFNGVGYQIDSIADVAKQDDFANRWQRVLLLFNGKLLVNRKQIVVTDPFTGVTRESFILKRYHENGAPDLAFGQNGIREFDQYIYPLAALADGKMLGWQNAQVVRFTYNGTVDPTFSALPGNYAVTDAAGRLYVTSYRSIRRYSADGAPDLDFGKQGEVQPPVSVMNPQILVEPTGNLLALQLRQSGSDSNNHTIVLLRYLDGHPLPPTATPPLTLLYAVLDNNLGDGWTRLINNIEMGVRAGAPVRLLINGPTDNDVYLYDLMQDYNPFCPNPTNPTCDGRYVEGNNFWRLSNENSAHPDNLYQFLVEALQRYPKAEKINLALIGHGSGWSANVLPGQPSIWRDQNETVGGMLWDDHPAVGQNESRSLSTKALGQALTWAGEQTGKIIDLLYLDGCSMGMTEVAYEVRNGARYLLASPNIDWASFNYHTLLPAVGSASGRTLGERWLQIEAAEFRANPGHPFTLALLDLSQMTGVAEAASALADSLRTLLPAQQAQLLTAFGATDRFDSDYDGDLDQVDAYSDLADFVSQLRQTLPTTATIQQAAQTLQNALTATVIAKDAAGGSPWLFNNQNWQWPDYGGLGIYLPLGQDEARRQLFYHANNLAWTADTTWDEFLADFWGSNAAATVTDMPVCHTTTQGCQGLANPLPVQTPIPQFVYLPVAQK